MSDTTRQSQLAASEALRIGLLQSALDCVIVVNDQGRVVEWNQAAAETFGYRREVALGAPLTELIVPLGLRAEFVAGLERYLSTGRSEVLDRRLELQAQCADGSEIEVELTVTPVRLRRTLFVGYLRDITEAKRAAAELKQAKEAAEESSRAKSRFLASVSHELRTPLTSILGFSELLERDEEADRERRSSWLRHIRASGEHLLALINDVLDLSKIEAGELHVERTPVHVLGLFAEVEQLVRPLAEAKGLALELRYLDPIPEHALTDALRLRQIVLNLVGNAIKFTDAGSVRVEVSAVPGDEELALWVEVQDTGPGIALADRERIFAAFSQTEAGRSRGGTGLGLDISRRLARRLGGDLTLESTPGQGSRFTATVLAGPVGTTALVNSASYDLRSFQRRAREDALRGRRCLVVDDHAPNRDLVSYLLEQRGAVVTTAVDGSHCLELIREQGETAFDVVLMDMQMPVLDGYETTRRLRTQGFRRPIVALTAHGMSQDRERCLAAGCDAYLSKPIDEPSLIRTLAQRLRRVPLRRFLRELPEEQAPPPEKAQPPGRGPASMEPLRSSRADDARFRPLLERFLTDLEQTAQPSLEAAVASRDLQALRGAAHKLLGSGGGCGLPQISEAAREVQRRVDAGDAWSDVAEAARALVEVVARAALGR